MLTIYSRIDFRWIAYLARSEEPISFHSKSNDTQTCNWILLQKEFSVCVDRIKMKIWQKMKMD